MSYLKPAEMVVSDASFTTNVAHCVCTTTSHQVAIARLDEVKFALWTDSDHCLVKLRFTKFSVVKVKKNIVY